MKIEIDGIILGKERDGSLVYFAERVSLGVCLEQDGTAEQRRAK